MLKQGDYVRLLCQGSLGELRGWLIKKDTQNDIYWQIDIDWLATLSVEGADIGRYGVLYGYVIAHNGNHISFHIHQDR